MSGALTHSKASKVRSIVLTNDFTLQAGQDQLYRRRESNWLSWDDVMRTKQAAVAAYNAASAAVRKGLLKTVLLIMLHSCAPPDRVVCPARESTQFPHAAHTYSQCLLPQKNQGVIRKLRLNLSLYKQDGVWVIDTTVCFLFTFSILSLF